MNMITTYIGQWGLSSEGTFKEKPWYSLCGSQVIEHGFDSPPTSFPIKKLPDGVVIPALVNAHTHLELSYMRGRVKLNSSMDEFIQQVRKGRKAVSAQEKRRKAFEALRYAYERGTYFYNDIANDAEFSLYLASCIYFHGNRFYELLGFSPEVSAMRLEETYRVLQTDREILVTPHSPYGTSPMLLQQMQDWSKNSLSIHLLESPEEYLLSEDKGEVVEFLKSIGQHTVYPDYQNKSLVEYLDAMGVFQYRNTFLVHLTNALDSDIDYLSKYAPHATWVLCHRSNRFLGLERKNFSKLLRSPLKMLIGTDSLASSPDVSILDELRALQLEDFVPESSLWQAATYSAYEHMNIHLYQIPYFFFEGASPSIESISEQKKCVLLNQNLFTEPIWENTDQSLILSDNFEEMERC